LVKKYIQENYVDLLVEAKTLVNADTVEDIQPSDTTLSQSNLSQENFVNKHVVNSVVEN
jgi:hypothetical protein